jgi:putative transcriptional regulator
VETLQGQLIIAGAGLIDPNFRRTIVLVGHHDDDGAVGVVLNRPSETPVHEAVPPLAELVGPGDPVFVGGPVQPQAAVVLAELDREHPAQSLVFGTVGFLLGEVDPADIAGVRRARIFAGYAGWGPGQLEAEMEQNSWLLEPALPDDVFIDRPEQLWERVLRRKGGEFALMSTMPVDPSTN